MKEDNYIDNPYLKKSAKLYKVYAGLFGISILTSVFLRPILIDLRGLIDLIVGLSILGFFVLAPLGLFYSWKSHKLKEGQSKTRFRYFIGHLFFCILILGFLMIMVNDFKQFF